MAHVTAWGHEARRRRLDLGLSQTRVAERVGVTPIQIGRWERGDEAPDPGQARALAAALRMDPEETEDWAASLPSGRYLAVEIVESQPLAPPQPAAAGGLEPDPWSVPPERRIRPPLLDRGALTGRFGDGGIPRARRALLGRDPSDTAVIPIAALSDDPARERVLRRQARVDERRLRRQLTEAQRRERHRSAAEARVRAEAISRAARSGMLPLAPAQRSAPPPAGAANTGSVFPVPDSRRRSERVTYEGEGTGWPENERLTYAMRVLLTAAILAMLAGLLWWAFGSLGDGLGAVLDLFRGDPDPGGVSEALLRTMPG